MTLSSARTPLLEIAYLAEGPTDGPTVILLHDFPYDTHAYDEVLPALTSAGCRDCGGRAACVVAALWPERVRGLVTCGGYNIQNIAASVTPAASEQEHRLWYHYYFHTERGRAGLVQNRAAFCRLLCPPCDGVDAHFAGPFQPQFVSGAGHNLPQEKPYVIVDAVNHLLRGF